MASSIRDLSTTQEGDPHHHDYVTVLSASV